MSDEAGLAPSASSGVGGGNGSRLYGASGEPLQTGEQKSQGQTDQLATFVQQQPLTAALSALVIGYLLGKIS